jgi:nicotinamide riboside kinase
MIKRINLFGGPGSSKSTTAAWLFSELKTRGKSVELVTEYVKSWAYDKKKVDEFDQIYLLGKQLHSEYRYLKAGVEVTATDSPVLLSGIYADIYYKELKIAQDIYAIADKYEIKYPSLNIFLQRNDRPYDPKGRYQTREQAVEIDKVIRDILGARADLKTYYLDYDDRNGIMDCVLENIG